MTQLICLTGDLYDRQLQELEAVRDAFVHRGVRFRWRPWQQGLAGLSGEDAVLLQGVGGYHQEVEAFARFLEEGEQAGLHFINPPNVVRWNMDKHYLRELESSGVAIVPTCWSRDNDAPLSSVMQEQGWQDAVAKPVISAGAYETRRVRSGDDMADIDAWYAAMCGRQPMMVQPFMPEIVTEGEWSLLFFREAYDQPLEDSFSHAVLKLPSDGDFRVQHEHGGAYRHLSPPSSLFDDAVTVLSHVPAGWCYARVDGVRRQGRLLVMEIELIEPFLYLLPKQEPVNHFVEALLRCLSHHNLQAA